jgi:hypothetical protein
MTIGPTHPDDPGFEPTTPDQARERWRHERQRAFAADYGGYKMSSGGSGVTDTSRLDISEKIVIASDTRNIRVQEAQGLRELVDSDLLPTQGLLGVHRPKYEAMGIKILDTDTPQDIPQDGTRDPLFCRVELPVGWKKVRHVTDARTSYLIDTQGHVRAVIFYKAAFYDRSADIYIPHPERAAAFEAYAKK